MVSPLNKWYASRRVDSELFLVQPLQAEEGWARKSWGGGGSLPPGICLMITDVLPLSLCAVVTANRSKSYRFTLGH